jgi:hypothetical protein
MRKRHVELTELSVRSAPSVLGYGSAFAVILYAFTHTGGQLRGLSRDPDVDEVSRKEYLRKNRRRPIEETVHELGEGRGKFPHIHEHLPLRRYLD